MTKRIRKELTCKAHRAGFGWDHTGTRQKTLHILEEIETGEQFAWDTAAEWPVGETRTVTFAVDGAYGGIPAIHNPRRVKA